MASEPKQVIVWRKDLQVRKGKIAAQCAHASMAVLVNMMGRTDNTSFAPHTTTYSFEIVTNSPIHRWLEGRFTKICVGVDTENELLELHQRANDARIPTALITDAGLTEFHGVPTNTCIAIGPWHAEQIDKITGHLKLL